MASRLEWIGGRKLTPPVIGGSLVLGAQASPPACVKFSAIAPYGRPAGGDACGPSMEVIHSSPVQSVKPE